MEPLEHDLRTKQQIKDALYSFLYAPVTKQFRARLDTLITRNTMLAGGTHRHFVYKGIVYNGEATQPPLRKTRLVAALRTEMDQYLSDIEELNNDELSYVLGFINQILNSSNSLTDYLRLLPESLHAPIKKMQATCPYRSTSLTEDKVEILKTKNLASIDLIKQRLVINLLI